MRNLLTEYGATKVITDANNPNGTFKNRTNDVLKDGTPLDELWTQDLWGAAMHLLNKAGIVPDGNQENETDSQIYGALVSAIVSNASQKNYVLNGDHRVNQTNFTGPVAAVSATYQSTDLWRTRLGSISGNIERVTTSQPVAYPGGASLKFTATSTLALDEARFEQQIESHELFQGQAVSLSVWVKSNSPEARAYIAPTTGQAYASAPHSGGGGWEKLSVIVPVFSASASTLLVGAGFMSANFADVPINSGEYFEFTAISLALTDKAPTYVPRPYGEELRLVKRLFNRVVDNVGVGAFTWFANGMATSTTEAYFVFNGIPEMRIRPTVTVSSTLSVFSVHYGGGFASPSALGLTSGGDYNSFYVLATMGSALLTVGQACALRLLSGTLGYIDLDARF